MTNYDLIGSAEAADILRVDRATLNRWAAKGTVVAEVRAPGQTGTRLFRRIDIERLAKSRRTITNLAS